MTKPKWSVISVVRNEAATLPRLLKSLSEFLARGGEFVVLDTGSKDNTAQVARDGGAKVFEVGDKFRYVVDEETAKSINEKFVVAPDPDIIKTGDSFFAFDKARNYAMGLASNDFVVTPDADEAWTTLNIDRINELIEQGYEKMFVDFVFSHHADGTPAVAFCADTRFYDRRRIKWKGIIHETMQHQGELKMTRLTKDVAYLEHYQNMATDRTKYLAGLAWACHEEPGNDRNSHYFARELMYRGRYHSAIKEFERHVAMNQWLDERAQSVVYMGCCYEALNDYDKALEYWGKAYNLCGTRREPLIHMAQYWKRHDNPLRVTAYAAAALQVPNNGFYGNLVKNYEDEPHSLMYWGKGWLGDIPAAQQHILKCLEYHPDDPTYLRDLEYYFPKPKVSIVIPAIRPDKLERCLAAIKENAGYENYEVIVEHDDPENPQGAPKVLKRGVERSTGELVMFLGDDTIPQKNFLIHAINAMRRQFPGMDGLIGLNDMYWHGEFFCHWLASRKLLSYLDGEFFHTGYYHGCCDCELTERCRKIGKAYYCEIAKVFHDHPPTRGGNSDKHYDRVYSKEFVKHDQDLLKERAKLLGFEISWPDYSWTTPKVSIVIPSIRPDKLERCLKAIKENANYPNYEVIVEKDDPDNPQGAPKVLKRGVEKSTGDLVMFIGDDTIPQKDFLLNAVNAMGKRFTDMDGLVALNDMINKGEVCSHWLASKRLLPYLGGEFFYTGYDHLFCDDELMARTKKIGKFHWAENAKVQHDHPVVHGWSEETYDKHYRRVFSNEAIAKGRALLEARSKELEFEIIPRATPKTLPWIEGRVINRIALPITRACNRDCPECSARMADPGWDRKNPHVSTDELRWVGKTLGPIGKVEMTGGEPTIHPDFKEISENIHDWFQCKDIMLLTNAVELYKNQDKLPLLLNYDRVYISWYTNDFALRYHTDANTEAVNFVEGYLKKNGRNVWIQRMDRHTPIGKPMYKGVPTCGYDKGDSVGYGSGRIYGCCTAYWLPFHGKSIPLTPDWREHLIEIGLPCPSCFLTGEAK